MSTASTVAQAAAHQAAFGNLPHGVVHHIGSRLGEKNLAALARTSRSGRDVARHLLAGRAFDPALRTKIVQILRQTLRLKRPKSVPKRAVKDAAGWPRWQTRDGWSWYALKDASRQNTYHADKQFGDFKVHLIYGGWAHFYLHYKGADGKYDTVLSYSKFTTYGGVPQPFSPVRDQYRKKGSDYEAVYREIDYIVAQPDVVLPIFADTAARSAWP